MVNWYPLGSDNLKQSNITLHNQTLSIVKKYCCKKPNIYSISSHQFELLLDPLRALLAALPQTLTAGFIGEIDEKTC